LIASLAAATVALSVALPLGAGSAEGATPADTATAPVIEFWVDTIEAGTKDANPGDGACATAATPPTCSLRAAIEEANATEPGPEVQVGVAPEVSGVIGMPDSDTAALMTTDWAAPLNQGAYFRITRTMTVDLDGRLGTVATGSARPVAAFWVDAPNVGLTGFTNVFSNQTSVVFGPTSDGSVLEQSDLVNSANNYPRALIRVRPGADDITIRDSTLGRSALASGEFGGMIRLTPTDDPTDKVSAIKNLTIERVKFDNTAVSGAACNASDGRGCSDTAIDTSDAPRLENLVIRGCTFNHFPAGRHAIDLADVHTASSLTIEDSVFTKIASGTGLVDATIRLNDKRNLAGPNYIRRNVFDNKGTTGQNFAIAWEGGNSTAGNVTRANTFIEDNHFDGYEDATILLGSTGTLTVRRNTFGTATASQNTTLNEESRGNTFTGAGDKASLMFMNFNNTSNRRIRGWFPSNAHITDQCELKVSVEQFWMQDSAYGTYYYPLWPVTLDFYYTTSHTAEVYLGSLENLTLDPPKSAMTVTVPDLPPGEGHIRVQTHGTGSSTDYPNTSPLHPESSQYSRTTPVKAPPAGCKSASPLSLDLRAWAGEGLDTAGHDSIIASGTAAGAEITDSVLIDESQPVWFTYTVTNTDFATLRNVLVYDSQANPVCVIERIQRGRTEGCSRART
jgi:hypothetical protein